MFRLILLASCQQTCMTYTIAVCTVKNSWWWTEELSENVEFYSKNKFDKLVHLVGFFVRIYHDAQSPERQIRKSDFSMARSCIHRDATKVRTLVRWNFEEQLERNFTSIIRIVSATRLLLRCTVKYCKLLYRTPPDDEQLLVRNMSRKTQNVVQLKNKTIYSIM